MSVHRLEREQLIERPLPQVFECFARAGNLERITPPWLSFGLVTPEPIPAGGGGAAPRLTSIRLLAAADR